MVPERVTALTRGLPVDSAKRPLISLTHPDNGFPLVRPGSPGLIERLTSAQPREGTPLIVLRDDNRTVGCKATLKIRVAFRREISDRAFSYVVLNETGRMATTVVSKGSPMELGLAYKVVAIVDPPLKYNTAHPGQTLRLESWQQVRTQESDTKNLHSLSWRTERWTSKTARWPSRVTYSPHSRSS